MLNFMLKEKGNKKKLICLHIFAKGNMVRITEKLNKLVTCRGKL